MILLEAWGGFTMPTPALWVIGLAALAGALHTLWTKVVRPLGRIVRTIHMTYEKVMEYDDRLTDVEDNTKQLTRNSGSHMADAVYRIEAQQKTDRQVFADHLLWAQEETKSVNKEITEIWKTLVARDVVRSAEKTAEKIDGTDGTTDAPD